MLTRFDELPPPSVDQRVAVIIEQEDVFDFGPVGHEQPQTMVLRIGDPLRGVIAVVSFGIRNLRAVIDHHDGDTVRGEPAQVFDCFLQGGATIQRGDTDTDSGDYHLFPAFRTAAWSEQNHWGELRGSSAKVVPTSGQEGQRHAVEERFFSE